MKHLLSLSICGLLLAASLCGCQEEVKETPNQKMIIYQVFTRLFSSDQPTNTFDGELEQNGVAKFNDFTDRALDSIKAMGITHIWYTGVIEHAYIRAIDTVGGIQKNHPSVIKGKAGSPYAIKDYYDVNSYLASEPAKRMEEFEALVARSHQAGLKVIIDFVPNHVARGYHSDVKPDSIIDLGAEDDTTTPFSSQNNFYYIVGKSLKPQFDTRINGVAYRETPAKVTGNDVFSESPAQGDWYETVKLNYGVDYLNNRQTHFDPIPNTWLKMRDIVLYWASKGVDGFRNDMAEMVPSAFWGWLIPQVKAQYPEVVFIAEIYNPNSYQEYINSGKFDYLYDKVGLYDTLKSVIQGRSPASAISVNRNNLAKVQSHMLNFLENHDEQRIACPEFAGNSQAGIPMMLVSTLMDNTPMMIYFGQELGEAASQAEGFGSADGRTTIFDFWTLPLYQAWRNKGAFDGARLPESAKALRSQYVSILKLANSEMAITNGQMIDLTAANAQADSAQYAFLRYYKNEILLIAVNLGHKELNCSINIPQDSYKAMGISQTAEIRAKSVLLGTPQNGELVLSVKRPITFTLAPLSGTVIKFIQ